MSVGTHAVITSDFPQWDREQLFEILNNIHDVVLVIDSHTTIVYANEAYARLLGVPVEKILGRRLNKIEPEAVAIKVMQTGKGRDGGDYLDSLGIDVEGSSSPLFKGESIVGCVSIFKNMTEVLRLGRGLHPTKQWKQLPLPFKEYVGQNSQLLDTLVLAAKVAQTDSTVLILGESGVGKEVLARVIHNSSRRKGKPLIKVNCAAIPEALIESELFGYEDGAFTGAKKGGKLGKFELAQNGTVFLDEIGDMGLTMQAKLLRVLQEREFERVGGTKTVKVDIRVIAATNRDLESMLEKGTFRRDLYYRLNIVPLNLTPLRERKDDILVLAQTFLDQFVREVGHELTLSPQVVRFFHAYEWPGNIRELQNVLEHASIVCSGLSIEMHHLPAHLIPTIDEQAGTNEKPFAVKEIVAKVEKELILSALAAYKNNRSNAMKALGISRRAFYDKLRRYGIE